MKKLLLSILCVGALFSSCDDDPIYKNSDNLNAKEYIEDSRNQIKQEIKLNTSELPKDITLKEGVKIHIPEGAFTKGGQPITGEFTIEAFEVLKPSSSIFTGTNTNFSGGSIFESDGYIYLDVKQNGVSVDQRLAENLSISIPTDKDGDWTQLWVGDEQSGEDENQFAWNEPGQGDVMGMEGNGAGAYKNYFDFGIGKLGWINCDIFWGNGKEMTTVTVELTGKVGTLASFMALDGDTYVFFCAKGVFVVAQLYTKVNETTVKTYDDSMPIGLEGKMMAFSIKDGVVSYASQDITISKDMKLTLDLQPITKDALDKHIKALDSYK